MMDANKKIINVLWADDKDVIGDLFPIGYEIIFKQRGINLLAQAKNASELDVLLKKYENEVDAVITDANMPKSDQWDDSDERDVSGLVAVLLHTIRSLKDSGRDVRFYLFSGRFTGRKKEILLSDKNISKELKEYFLDEDRWFEKGIDNEKLFIRLREDFEKEPPIQYKIRNKYKEELEAAELVGERATRLLMEDFLREYNNDKTVPIDDFNAARKVLESINSECHKHHMIPRLSLNSFKNLLRNRKLENTYGEIVVELLEDLMPEPLVEEIELFLKFTNSGSHIDEQIQKEFERYIKNAVDSNEFIYVYRITINILMDLLLWYKRILKKYENHSEPLYKGDLYIDEVEIIEKRSFFDRYENKRAYYFTGQSTEKNETYTFAKEVTNLKPGLIVGIIKRENNINYQYDYYVHQGNYEIIEDGE